MKKVLLQLAMDGAYNGRTVSEAVNIIKSGVYDYVDIIEIGSSMIYRWGMSGVQEMKKAFPDKVILADMKIMDGGTGAATMACQLGADIVTVMGITHKETIKNVNDAAHSLGARVMVDFMCIDKRNIKETIEFCESINVDYICSHYAVDKQAHNDNDDCLNIIAANLNKSKLAIAGGITAENVENVLSYGPEIVISGKGIYGTENPTNASKKLKDKIIHWEQHYGK